MNNYIAGTSKANKTGNNMSSETLVTREQRERWPVKVNINVSETKSYHKSGVKNPGMNWRQRQKRKRGKTEGMGRERGEVKYTVK